MRPQISHENLREEEGIRFETLPVTQSLGTLASLGSTGFSCFTPKVSKLLQHLPIYDTLWMNISIVLALAPVSSVKWMNLSEDLAWLFFFVFGVSREGECRTSVSFSRSVVFCEGREVAVQCSGDQLVRYQWYRIHPWWDSALFFI